MAARGPADLYHSWFAFIPKNVNPTDVVIQKTPAELRPLSISNTDRKVVAKAVCNPSNAIGQRVCLDVQRGGMSGRLICDGVFVVEAYAQMCCRYSDKFPAIALFDLKAVFPSIEW